MACARLKTQSKMRVFSVDRVKAALRWYEENVEGNPSADDVAKAVGVTRGHLRRMFIEAGMSAPKTEFARLRMAVAQRCLISG